MFKSNFVLYEKSILPFINALPSLPFSVKTISLNLISLLVNAILPLIENGVFLPDNAFAVTTPETCSGLTECFRCMSTRMRSTFNSFFFMTKPILAFNEGLINPADALPSRLPNGISIVAFFAPKTPKRQNISPSKLFASKNFSSFE